MSCSPDVDTGSEKPGGLLEDMAPRGGQASGLHEPSREELAPHRGLWEAQERGVRAGRLIRENCLDFREWTEAGEQIPSAETVVQALEVEGTGQVWDKQREQGLRSRVGD